MTNNELLAYARKAWALTQVEMAEAIGVSRKAVQKWEQGERGCPEPVARLIKCMWNSMTDKTKPK